MFDNSDLNSSIKLRTPLRFVISLLFFSFLSVQSQSVKCKDFPLKKERTLVCRGESNLKAHSLEPQQRKKSLFQPDLDKGGFC